MLSSQAGHVVYDQRSVIVEQCLKQLMSNRIAGFRRCESCCDALLLLRVVMPVVCGLKHDGTDTTRVHVF